MSNQTPINDLLTLKTPVDEVEISPDDGMDREPGEIDESPKDSEPAAARTDEPKPQQQPQAKTAAKPEPEKPAQTPGEQTDDGTNLQGLPKAHHARVKAADERKRAAEERASTAERTAASATSRVTQLERELAEAREANQKWQDWYEDQSGKPVPPAQPEARPQQQQPDLNAVLAERDYKLRSDFGYRTSIRENGKELTDQAAIWAQDRAATDQNFTRQILTAPDPVAFAVEEFRKAQVQDELASYGYDLEKLVAARAGKQPQTQPQSQQASPAATATRKPTPSMPSDFASQPSGGSRAEPVWAGPTPLGDLLKQSRG